MISILFIISEVYFAEVSYRNWLSLITYGNDGFEIRSSILP